MASPHPAVLVRSNATSRTHLCAQGESQLARPAGTRRSPSFLGHSRASWVTPVTRAGVKPHVGDREHRLICLDLEKVALLTFNYREERIPFYCAFLGGDVHFGCDLLTSAL